MPFNIEYHIEESTLTIKFASYEALIHLSDSSNNSSRFLKELKIVLDRLSSFKFIRKEDLPKEFSDESPYDQPLDLFELRYDALFDRDRLNVQCKLNVFF